MQCEDIRQERRTTCLVTNGTREVVAASVHLFRHDVAHAKSIAGANKDAAERRADDGQTLAVQRNMAELVAVLN